MKKLYKCRWDKKIGGVCGGLGQYFKIDPTIIRLLFIFLGILTGVIPFILLYLLLLAILPEGPPTYVEIPGRKLYRSKKDKKIAGVCGGLGKYFGIDPTIIRAGFLIVTFTTFIIPLSISYIIAALVIPEEPTLN